MGITGLVVIKRMGGVCRRGVGRVFVGGCGGGPALATPITRDVSPHV